MPGLRVFIPLILLLLFTTQFASALTLSGSSLQGGEVGRQASATSASSVEVYISSSQVYSRQPSFILIHSPARPTVNVDLTVTVELGGPLGGTHSFTESYTLEAIPVTWAPHWYVVPVPGLPAKSLVGLSVKSRVDYTVLVDGNKAVSGGYDILEESVEKSNLPPLVYAFVGDVFSDEGLVEETWGLSPRGWSLNAGKAEEIYVFVVDDTGIQRVVLEYRVGGGSWVNVTLNDSHLLDPILDVIEGIREGLSDLLPQPDELAPVFPVKLLVGSIPGQDAGTYVEYRAYAVDVDGTISYAPHGLYYVDTVEGGSRILIIDPWVMIWALTRVALDHRPVVAVDLAHGENDKYLDTLISRIEFVEWVILDNTITPEILERVDILIIGQPQQSFTQQELDAIAEWFRRGGKVIWVAGDSDYSGENYNGPATQEICNEILSSLGSRLRLETGGVYDDVNNIGGKSYRVLGFVKQDFVPGMHTRLLSAGVSKPILFHGPTAIIWVDENGGYRDPVQETFPGLVRIAWSANTSRIQDNSPPHPMLYSLSTSQNRGFVLMAAEKLEAGSLVIVSGETPYGGFEPISTPEYMDVELDGPQFVENVILWASFYVLRSRYLAYIDEYGFPPGNISELDTVPLQLSMAGIVNFHHWEYLGEANDIYIVYPSQGIFDLLKSLEEGGFEPHVVVLSNLGLGPNWTGTPLLDWDLRDIEASEAGTLLDRLIEYVKGNHAGLIATHSTLSDLIIWESCETQVKIGSRGHVGYDPTDMDILNERTIAAMLGMPQLALWEYVRDQIAYTLCTMGESMGSTPTGIALYATGLTVGSTPLQVPYVLWNGTLMVTEEGEALDWNIPSEITVYIPSIYEKREYRAYTQVGWQLALPRVLMYSAVTSANTTVEDAATLYGYLSALFSNYSLEEPLKYSLGKRGLGILYDAIVNASYTQEALEIAVDPGFLNSSLRGMDKLQLSVDVGNVMGTLLRLMPVKLVAVSEHGEAAIIAHDKYWDINGYRAVYFSFEVEASPDEMAKSLLLEAVKWASSWEYQGPLDLIGGILPVPEEIKETYDQILENTPGVEVLSEGLILPENGEARLEVDTVPGNTYHIIVAHPTTDTVKIEVENGVVKTRESDNKVTYITVKASTDKIELTVKPSSQLSLNPAYVTVKEEEEQTQTTTPHDTTTTPPTGTETTPTETTTPTTTTTTTATTTTTIITTTTATTATQIPTQTPIGPIGLIAVIAVVAVVFLIILKRGKQ